MNTEQLEARIKEEQEAKDRLKRAQAKLWAKQLYKFKSNPATIVIGQ